MLVMNFTHYIYCVYVTRESQPARMAVFRHAFHSMLEHFLHLRAGKLQSAERRVMRDTAERLLRPNLEGEESFSDKGEKEQAARWNNNHRQVSCPSFPPVAEFTGTE